MFKYILLSTIFILTSVSCIYAADMESPRFRIESGSIDFTIPENNSQTASSVKNPESDEFDRVGVLVKSDNQSTKNFPFRIVVEKSLLSMKDIVPNTPSVTSSVISVTGGRTAYQVTATELDQLKKLSGEAIPDTQCSVKRRCTYTLAAPWDSISSYGFGYSLSGQDIPKDFENSRFFRPFSNSGKNKETIVIMKGTDKSDERHSTITLKSIVSAVQADGTYETVIEIAAIPGY